MLNSRMGRAGLAAALLTTTMLTAAPQAFAQSTVDELVVTAQKREENLQNVALSIQAIGNEKLEQLQVNNFDDFAKFLPSVSYQTAGPGFTSIFMRGVASGENGNHSGPVPSVGFYLDEQPITTIQGPLDIHVYDIARVESLVGPQGTLYGASSQSGTIRIITNKPKIGVFEGTMDAEVNGVDHGGVGYGLEGFVNVPVTDKAAIRLVGWAQHDAGYVDNILGSRTYPTWGGTDTNEDMVEDNYNDVDTYGARAALKVDLNENWTITPTVMAQDQKAGGSFAYDPRVGDLQLIHFNPESSHDRWIQGALTIEGKIGNLDLTYNGALLKRRTQADADYSDYSYAYDALYGYYVYDNNYNYTNPSQYIQQDDRFTKQSHEFRIATPADNRLRAIAGVFYQRQTHDIQQRYKINNLLDAWEVPGWDDTI
ncbi:MAG: TonB-dependent receptor [Caulobacteraceae bacterium]